MVISTQRGSALVQTGRYREEEERRGRWECYYTAPCQLSQTFCTWVDIRIYKVNCNQHAWEVNPLERLNCIIVKH